LISNSSDRCKPLLMPRFHASRCQFGCVRKSYNAVLTGTCLSFYELETYEITQEFENRKHERISHTLCLPSSSLLQKYARETRTFSTIIISKKHFRLELFHQEFHRISFQILQAVSSFGYILRERRGFVAAIQIY